MEKREKKKSRGKAYLALGVLGAVLVYAIVLPEIFAGRYDSGEAEASTTTSLLAKLAPENKTPVLDTALYDKMMRQLAHISATSSATTTKQGWPVKQPYPKAGALLPFNRIVAYYGNFYSTKMGVLGEYDTPTMLAKLQSEVVRWKAADPSTPVIPAIHYIVTTAQGSPQPDNTYRLRMPADQIEKAINIANNIHGVVFLDIQVGLSNLPAELPRLEPYLKHPNVFLAIDPEFAMYGGHKPGTVIGTMSASDINYAISFLDRIAKENNLPPKILVIHRFTDNMVTGYKNIKPMENVQVVMDMDGWGFGAKKINTYKQVITSEPVQFTGFKLFYKNDLKPPSTRMLTPQEVLSLQPAPSYIQYQ